MNLYDVTKRLHERALCIFGSGFQRTAPGIKFVISIAKGPYGDLDVLGPFESQLPFLEAGHEYQLMTNGVNDRGQDSFTITVTDALTFDPGVTIGPGSFRFVARRRLDERVPTIDEIVDEYKFDPRWGHWWVSMRRIDLWHVKTPFWGDYCQIIASGKTVREACENALAAKDRSPF